MFFFALWCVCDDFHVYDLYYIILYLLKLFYNHIIYNLVVDMTAPCSLDEVVLVVVVFVITIFFLMGDGQQVQLLFYHIYVFIICYVF